MFMRHQKTSTRLAEKRVNLDEEKHQNISPTRMNVWIRRQAATGFMMECTAVKKRQQEKFHN